MRLFTGVLAIVFSFCSIIIAEDFDFSLLALPQERLKTQVVPIPVTKPPQQWEPPTQEITSEKPIGALLLKTGFMYLGEAILVDKNVYHVIGARGKPKIPAYKVEYAGVDRHDIYQYKRSRPETASYSGAYALAKWCMANGMHDEAIAEFQNCKSYAQYPQMIKQLDKEILAAEDVKRNAQRRAIAENAVVEMITNRVPADTSEESFDLRTWRLAVDPAVLEKFSKDVQPQLLRRCAAADCHGSNSVQEFRLTQPLQKYSTAEATLRNLKAAFDQIDFQQPANSPLLIYPQKDHGGTKAIYTRSTRNQLTPIFQWVQLVPNTMPDFVEKYLTQKQEAEYATIQSGYSRNASQVIAAQPPSNYGPIEQVGYEFSRPVATNFPFFEPDQPVEQRVELIPNSNSFRLQPRRPAVLTGEGLGELLEISAPQPAFIPANTDSRQYHIPTQVQAKDPFDPSLFNQKYHEKL